MSKNIVTSQESIHNQIIAGTVITGDIFTEGNIKIDGRLNGKLTSQGRVVIGDSGVVEGEIICNNAQISGSVSGKILCEDLLLLRATAQINGDVKTNKLSIEPGALFTGYCSMDGGNKNNEPKSE